MNGRTVKKLEKMIRKEMRLEIADMISNLSRENFFRRIYVALHIVFKITPKSPIRPKA